MKFFATPVILLVFNIVFSFKAHASDVIPFHVISSTEHSITIDLDKNIPAPKTISVFGESGWSTATLKKQVNKCVYLCGEDHEAGKECHNEGVYLLNTNNAQGSLKGPLLAIAGKVRIQNAREPIQFKKSKPADDKYLSKEFSQGYRWARDETDGKTYLFSEYMGPKGVGSKDWYAPGIRLDSCTSKAYQDFEILGCSGVTLLYHQRELVEMSIAEYSSGELDLKFSIKINGKTYYVVEVSVKGHGQRLKLITQEDKKWMGFLRKPTYAGLC